MFEAETENQPLAAATHPQIPALLVVGGSRSMRCRAQGELLSEASTAQASLPIANQEDLAIFRNPVRGRPMKSNKEQP